MPKYYREVCEWCGKTFWLFQVRIEHTDGTLWHSKCWDDNPDTRDLIVHKDSV